jgi:hypothetical protein
MYPVKKNYDTSTHYEETAKTTSILEKDHHHVHTS